MADHTKPYDSFGRFLGNPNLNYFIRLITGIVGETLWWYSDGDESDIQILEAPSGFKHPLAEPETLARTEWLKQTFEAIRTEESKGKSTIISDGTDTYQMVIPVISRDQSKGFLGITCLSKAETTKLTPFLPLLTEHIGVICDRMSAIENLQSIQRLWKEVVSTLDLDVLLDRILKEILIILDVQEGLLLLEDHEHRLTVGSVQGFDAESVKHANFHFSVTPYENKMLGWPHAARPLSLGDPLRDCFLSLYPVDQSQYGVNAIPLAHGGNLFGLVLCPGKEGTNLPADVESALETLAFGSSVAIRNAKEFERMRQKAVALGTVHSVYRLVATTRLVGDLLSKQGILSRLGKLILQVLNVSKCSIMLVDESAILIPSVVFGFEEGEICTNPLPIGQGIPGVALGESNSILIENPLDDVRFTNDPTEWYRSPCYLSVPMFEAEAVGVITVAGRNGGGIRFTEGEREVLHTMAEQAVIALLNVEFFERQEKMALKTMGAFDNLFETGDPEKEGHAQRLARMLDAFGVFLKIDVQTRQVCQMVAFIHNIALLKITQANRAFRKNVDDDLKHIEVGMRMARRLDLPEKTVSILRDHHEHFDGSGQPRGLKGDEIPLGARLLTLLDYYMSMVTPVPHGAGLRPVDALKLIQNYSGSFFDPNLVESFNKFMSLRSNEFGNEE